MYVDARYSLAFEVSRERLETLASYVCAFRGERRARARSAPQSWLRLRAWWLAGHS
jgi:hypothetical protein